MFFFHYVPNHGFSFDTFQTSITPYTLTCKKPKKLK